MSLYHHRGRELWRIFQLEDSAMEGAIDRIDSEIGAGHGLRVYVCMCSVDDEGDHKVHTKIFIHSYDVRYSNLKII